MVERSPRTDLSNMALFFSIVKEGALSAAARALGIPKATVSRRLVGLERQAGTSLVARSTRALALTDAGRRHYERVRDLVRDAQAAQAELMAGSAEPSGLLRISASISYGQLVIAPAVVAFAARHPRLRIELDLSDERVDLIADRFDLVVRMGPMEDSELMSRRLADMPMVLVASPLYLERNGEPQSPVELANHDAIVSPAWLDHWQVGRDEVRMQWRLSTHSLGTARLAALAAVGIARVPLFVVADDLAAGTLNRVLPEVDLPRSPATALYARTGATSVAMRLLLAKLADQSGRQSELSSTRSSL